MSTYDADLFLHDIAARAELRDCARRDPAAALDRYELTAAEKDLFLRGEVGLLYRGGVNDFLLHNVARFDLFGVDVDTYSARMRAESTAVPPKEKPMTPVAKFVLLQVRPERKQELLALLEANRQHTKNEPGTQMWTLHSVRDEPDRIAMYEVYDDDAAAAAHDAGNPALAEILTKLSELLADDPTIVTLDVTATRQDP